MIACVMCMGLICTHATTHYYSPNSCHLQQSAVWLMGYLLDENFDDKRNRFSSVQPIHSGLRVYAGGVSCRPISWWKCMASPILIYQLS